MGDREFVIAWAGKVRDKENEDTISRMLDGMRDRQTVVSIDI